MKKLLSLTLILLTFSSFAQISITKYNDSITNGFVYSLPKKSFVVEIHYTETITTPGIYADFAEEMLGITDAAKETRKSYTIDNIVLKPFTEPDENAKFVATIDGSSKAEKAYNIMLDANGIINGISRNAANISNHNESHITALYNDNAGAKPGNNFEIVPTTVFYNDTIYSDSTLDLSYEVVSTFEEISLEERADEAVEHMLTVRQQRIDLLAGFQEVAYSMESLKYMERTLLEIENTYLNMFRGKTTSTKKVHSLIYSPSISDSGKEVPILCFSKETGICNSKNGTQITAVAMPRNNVVNPKTGSSKSSKSTKQESILSYRNPVATDIKIMFDKKVYTGGIYMVPQLGKITTIDISKCKTLLFDNQTGSILRYEVE